MRSAQGFAAHGLSKRFGATQALDDVSLRVRSGEIHAVLGENGAGKSTLIKIMSGLLEPDSGNLTIDDQPIADLSPKVAFEKGIVVVHQELSLLPNLSVAQNIFISRPPTGSGRVSKALGLLSRRQLVKRARESLRGLGVDIDPSAKVATLGPAERQLVEIVRAFAQSARLVLLDEPTSSLPPDERSDLFDRLKVVKENGISVVFITHLLDEALEISDTITVLRDGRNVGTRTADEITMDQLVELMTGRPHGSVYPARASALPSLRAKLSVENLACAPKLKSASFSVNKGEIIGLAGLVGSGRTECLKAIFGDQPKQNGVIRIDGEMVSFDSTLHAIRAGLAMIPEDRQEESLFSDHSVLSNICIAAACSAVGEPITKWRGLLLDRKRMLSVALRLRDKLLIKLRSVHGSVSLLSGGNQQKVVLARWLATKPDVILADEPTRGVSIGSKVEIYRLIRDLAAGGSAVVLVSSEFEELVGLCDRIVIMSGGRSVGEIGTDGIGAGELLHLVLTASRQALAT